MRRGFGAVVLWLLLAATTAAAHAQAKAEEKPKTLWEEVALSAYVENSYVWNLGHTGRDDVNELRLYDFDAGWSFNMAELAVKKEPSERYPFGFGLVVTAGGGAAEEHARRAS